MTVPTITALPDFPVRGEDPVTFAQKANDSVAAYPTMVTQMNAMGEFVEEQAELAFDAAEIVVPAAAAAVGAANYKGEWSTLSGALAIPASVSHNGSVWLLTASVSNVAAVEPGIDPVWINLLADSGLEIGALQYFAGPTTSTYPGAKWVVANGSVLTQTAYSGLYSAIGLLPDGARTWTPRTSGTASDIIGLTYGDNLYVYAGIGGVLATSTDAITWTARTSGTASSIQTLVYGNNLYVYAGVGGVLATSTDAITWTARTSGTASNIIGLTYGNNLYVYAGQGGVLATSTDAITWTARTSGTASFISSLAYLNNLYVYAGVGGVLATSTDAITWTARTSGTTESLRALTYANGLYVAVGDASVVCTSTNAVTWTVRTTGLINTNWFALTYAEGQFLIGGGSGRVATSNNAITWTLRTSGTTSFIQKLVYGNNLFVYSTQGGGLGTSAPYTYNTATEFVVPIATVSSIVESANALYIKAE